MTPLKITKTAACAALQRVYISQKPFGNGLAIRKVLVRREEIVAADDNIDLLTAQYLALEAGLRETSAKLFHDLENKRAKVTE